MKKAGKTLSVHLSAEDYEDFRNKVSRDFPGLSEGAVLKQVVVRWIEQGVMGDLRIDSSKLDEVASQVSEILKIQSEVRAKQVVEFERLGKLLAEVHKKIPIVSNLMTSKAHRDDQGIKGLTVAIERLIGHIEEIK